MNHHLDSAQCYRYFPDGRSEILGQTGFVNFMPDVLQMNFEDFLLGGNICQEVANIIDFGMPRNVEASLPSSTRVPRPSLQGLVRAGRIKVKIGQSRCPELI